MSVVELKAFTRTQKEALARELGYAVRDGYLYQDDGTPLLDRYTQDHIRADNMAILPGSLVVLDNNPVSLAEYFVDYDESGA